MKYLTNFIHYLAKSDERSKRAYEDAYLAKSANIYDLESRMRELEQQQHFHPWARITQN